MSSVLGAQSQVPGPLDRVDNGNACPVNRCQRCRALACVGRSETKEKYLFGRITAREAHPVCACVNNRVIVEKVNSVLWQPWWKT
jgi:hypothetical protein